MADNTHKKIKIIGKQDYINHDTGELIEMQVIEMGDQDYNFEKIWLSHILEAIETAGNQKIKVISYLLKTRDKTSNLILKSQRDIASESGVSLQTVSITMKMLVECNMLIKQKSNIYMLNPNVIFKGRHKNRMNILLKYNKAKVKE